MQLSADSPAPDVPVERLPEIAPRSVREALPLGGWRRDALWGLRLPVRAVAVAELDWLLDLRVWQACGRHFAVSPREVLAEPERLRHQYARAMAADLGYPVHLCGWRGRTVILDGFHRLLKAVVLGRDEVQAMTLTAADLEAVGALEGLAGADVRCEPRRGGAEHEGSG